MHVLLLLLLLLVRLSLSLKLLLLLLRHELGLVDLLHLHCLRQPPHGVLRRHGGGQGHESPLRGRLLRRHARNNVRQQPPGLLALRRRGSRRGSCCRCHGCRGLLLRSLQLHLCLGLGLGLVHLSRQQLRLELHGSAVLLGVVEALRGKKVCVGHAAKEPMRCGRVCGSGSGSRGGSRGSGNGRAHGGRGGPLKGSGKGGSIIGQASG